MAISELDGWICSHCEAQTRPKRLIIENRNGSEWWKIQCRQCWTESWLERQKWGGPHTTIDIATMATGIDAHHQKAIKGRKI